MQQTSLRSAVGPSRCYHYAHIGWGGKVETPNDVDTLAGEPPTELLPQQIRNTRTSTPFKPVTPYNICVVGVSTQY